MNFIERYFGAAPDGGDGSLEFLWSVAIVVAIVALLFRRRILRWLGHDGGPRQD